MRDLGEQMTFEDSQLLRRLIARRCIYGVDLNPLSVELARLSIWIHTFVPGLPLSVLDHNLVNGNALVGIGTVDEIEAKFEAAGTSLFPVDALKLLGQAARPLRRLANLSDATLNDVAHAREAMEEARVAVEDTRALCDIITAQRLNAISIPYQFENWEKDRTTIQKHPSRYAAAKVLEGLTPFHFPVAFPEVFLRPRAGFDVILGNPPWGKIRTEGHEFWARHFPGLRGMPQREQEVERTRLKLQRPDLANLFGREVEEMDRVRKVLTTGAYPGMGTGDPDLYKAFSWRFWNLVNHESGRIGVVLPRSVFALKGSESFRKRVIDQALQLDLTMLLNKAGWVFDEAEHRYTVALSTITRGVGTTRCFILRGPYSSLERYTRGICTTTPIFELGSVSSWNETASIPLLPTDNSIDVFAQLRRAPRLDQNSSEHWRARPDRELDSSGQKGLMDFTSEQCPEGFWPVLTGESFDIWTPDAGTPYAFADPKAVIAWLQQKRTRSARSRPGSAHSEFRPEWIRDATTLPCYRTRIAFRRHSRATDTRTVRVCLLPPNVFLVDQAPYFLWPRGDQRDEAFLLGVMSSFPFDWYCRRMVETDVNYFLLNPSPVPRPDRSNRNWRRVVSLAGRLASPDNRFATWAKSVDVGHGALLPDEKQDMINELDAVVAHLYGLSEKQLVHIFETFHEGWDYEERLRKVLKHFARWRAR